MKKDETMTETLRRAILEDPAPMHEVAEATGLNVASICNFKNDVRSMRLDKADLLAQHYGLILKRRRK